MSIYPFTLSAASWTAAVTFILPLQTYAIFRG